MKKRKWSVFYYKPHKLLLQFHIALNPPHEEDYFDKQWSFYLSILGFAVCLSTWVESDV